MDVNAQENRKEVQKGTGWLAGCSTKFTEIGLKAKFVLVLELLERICRIFKKFVKMLITNKLDSTFFTLKYFVL